MFGIFKRKSRRELLEKKYRELLQRSFELSTTSRAESDRLQAAAHEVMKELEQLKE